MCVCWHVIVWLLKICRGRQLNVPTLQSRITCRRAITVPKTDACSHPGLHNKQTQHVEMLAKTPAILPCSFRCRGLRAAFVRGPTSQQSGGRETYCSLYQQEVYTLAVILWQPAWTVYKTQAWYFLTFLQPLTLWIQAGPGSSPSPTPPPCVWVLRKYSHSSFCSHFLQTYICMFYSVNGGNHIQIQQISLSHLNWP